MGLEKRRSTQALTCAAWLAAAIIASLSPVAAGPLGQRGGSIQLAMADLEAFGFLDAPIARPPGDMDYLPQLITLYRNGDFAEADILRSKLSQPGALALAEWLAYRMGDPVDFDRIETFRKDYPDWPDTASLRRREEAALLKARKPASLVRAYFSKQPPATGAGRIALAFALKSDNADEQAAAMIRTVWREETFGPDMEKRILDQFPDVLGKADHRFRMERFLFKENWGGALRAAGYAGKEYETLVKARMGAFQGGKRADKAFAAVPASLRSDSSFIFSQALCLRRKGKLIEAGQMMNRAPRDPDVLVDGDEWWSERRLISRTLLDQKDAKAAYDVASHHGAESPSQRIEAEFHSGWIALRFLGDHEAAAKHFAEAANIASTPISISRAAYWQGRAAEAAGAGEDAKRFYRRAAEQPITYYGQLAREKLGLPLELRKPEPVTAEARLAFEALTAVQALKLLRQLGEEELAIALSVELAQTLGDPVQLNVLGTLAEEQGSPRAMLAVGKIAVQRGFPLDIHAYPTVGIPDFTPVGDEVEPAMVYAIARQESAFNPRALSSAGARGLMQLMPATAKRTAQRFGLSFDVDRLTQDPAYNAKLGSAHLGELMDDWRGSHVLAFASYNAGGGNVMKWIRTYGDPRRSETDWVDWIERIPFYETRNYVQRVMENLNVYRWRLGPKPSSLEAHVRPESDGTQ